MWSRTFVKVLLIGAAAIGLGLFVNHFRGQPLALRYAPKQERLDAAVARVGNKGFGQSAAGSAASDQEGLKAFSELIGKKTENAYARTLEVWKQGGSAEFLRSAFSVARTHVKTTDEVQMLDLMGKALDDPAPQWRECERLSRGNSLEKLIASRRIAVLEMNPQVNAARNAASVQPSFPVADHAQEIQWEVFRALVDGKNAALVDARPEKIYKLGHVPGALNISRELFASDYEKAKANLEADKERPVAVYCNGLDCEESKMVAGALIKLGFRRVLIFKGGWREWTFQHLPEETK